MERGSTKHSQHLDEALARTTRDGRGRADQSRDLEPPAEDMARPEAHPVSPAAPPGMTDRDVGGRAEFAKHVPASAFPAHRDALMVHLAGAPEEVRGAVRTLPPGVDFRNVTEVWAALGHGREDDHRRF